MNNNQLDLERYTTCGWNLQKEDYLNAFRVLYDLNSPMDSVIMLDDNLDTLFKDSDIKIIDVFEHDVLKDDEGEIINQEIGDLIGYIVLEQNKKRYFMCTYVANNGCMLSDGCDFETLTRCGDMFINHNGKEYKLLLETSDFRFYIHDDELIMIDELNGEEVNDDDYSAKAWFEDSLELIATGFEYEFYMDAYEKQARKELGEPYGKSI